MTAGPVFECSDLSVRYGDRVAVDRVSFSVRRGEILGLLGPNGSGKSSTIKAISGILRPAAGSIRVAGVGPENPTEFRRQIGLVPQDLALYDELTPLDNLTLFATLYGFSGERRRNVVRTALDAVRLADQARRPVRTLSGGMQRRVNLACALVHDPPLLVFDEPTVGLDLPSRDEFYGLLDDLRRRGRGMLLATHQLEEADGLCDRLAVLNQGRLVAVGTSAELERAARVAAIAQHSLDDCSGLERAYRRLTQPVPAFDPAAESRVAA